MPDPAAPEGDRFELANVRLLRFRSRHYRIPDPSIYANEAGICAADRHRWPCHATTLLNTLVEVLKLTRDPGGKDLDAEATVTAGEIRDALARGLLTPEAA